MMYNQCLRPTIGRHLNRVGRRRNRKGDPRDPFRTLDLHAVGAIIFKLTHIEQLLKKLIQIIAA